MFGSVTCKIGFGWKLFFNNFAITFHFYIYSLMILLNFFEMIDQHEIMVIGVAPYWSLHLEKSWPSLLFFDKWSVLLFFPLCVFFSFPPPFFENLSHLRICTRPTRVGLLFHPYKQFSPKVKCDGIKAYNE